MSSVKHNQDLVKEMKEISFGISKKDLEKISILHGMNKDKLMMDFNENLKYLGTQSVDDISNFVKIALFIMIDEYMLNQSTMRRMKDPLFKALHGAMNLETLHHDEVNDFYRNYKVPCFDLLCTLYAKIRSLIKPTSNQFRETIQYFLDIVCGLIPDIHYLFNEKYPVGSFFGIKQDQFEKLGLFQKLFFEITSQQFESVSFSKSDVISRRTIQKLFEDVNTTLQKV